MNIYKELLSKKVSESVSSKVDLEILDTISHSIDDEEYIIFLSKKTNGGFFYKRSLQLYGACLEPRYQNIILVNKTIKQEYGSLVNELIFFGQDVFGNQFAFSPKGIIFFNIETAEQEIIANSFRDWVKILEDEVEFYTGVDFVSAWEAEKGLLSFEERLCAKVPFIMGGDYVLKNLYSQNFPKYILSNANIARQVYNLKDGTDVKLVVEE